MFAGPRPADALRRFTAATGRQPPPPAPWAYGPWFQTGQPNVTPLAEEAEIVRKFRDADAPVSAAETQMHFLPCGAQRGREAYELARTRQFHAAGLAHLSYFNPHLCTAYQPVYDEAVAAGALQLGPDGRPITFPAFVGGGGAGGFTIEPLAQFDFTARATAALYSRLVREALDQGKDGFMEDFGEYTSPVARSADGTPPARIHNRYPRDYHCALQRMTRGYGRPVVRFQRSGWTGTARCSVNVWGGDPTTVWGFDGLRSAVTQALTIGMSGVARWGSDIGGYNSFGAARAALARAARPLDPVRGGVRPDAHEAVGDRPARVRAAAGVRPGIDADLAALREAPHAAAAVHRGGGRRVPGDRNAAHAARAAHRPRRPARDPRRRPVRVRPGPARRAGAAAGRAPALALPAARALGGPLALRPLRGVATAACASARRESCAGRRRATLPAPRDELPLLVRAGAVLPLLPADVDTLAPYAGAGVVRLADRRDRMQLLAFPRGRSRVAHGRSRRAAGVG